MYQSAQDNFAFLGKKPKTSLINSGIISLDLTRKPSSPTHTARTTLSSLLKARIWRLILLLVTKII